MREIFLINFSGIQYGVWKDEIQSVKNIDALHRIPLSAPQIAGITIANDQAVTLADLSICIGYQAAAPEEGGSVLLLQNADTTSGFAVGGQLETLSVSTEQIFPLPDYLNTAAFDSCAIHQNIAIPLLNLQPLYAHALLGDDALAADALPPFSAQALNISAIAEIRLFTLAGDIYAAAGIENSAAKQQPTTPLPKTPRHVSGIAFFDGQPLPVIDLPQRIKGTSAAAGAPMLISELAGKRFGLLVDDDMGSLPASEFTFQPLPLIVQSAWLRHAVLQHGKIIPLVDIGPALSRGAPDETPVWERYTPTSQFSAQFSKQDVEILEFSLLGEPHALPGEEVQEVIPCQPCRALPNVPPIVIGVAEHRGELLPVLDLAMIFGRRSIVTPAWRMIVLDNGDFRALIITETVLGKRMLPLDAQREVPIHLPHHLLYGCYIDENLVRIILNIHNIAVHFEKSLIHHFLPALSSDMRMASTGEDGTHDSATATVSAPITSQIAAAQTQADSTALKGSDDIAPQESVPTEQTIAATGITATAVGKDKTAADGKPSVPKDQARASKKTPASATEMPEPRHPPQLTDAAPDDTESAVHTAENNAAISTGAKNPRTAKAAQTETLVPEISPRIAPGIAPEIAPEQKVIESKAAKITEQPAAVSSPAAPQQVAAESNYATQAVATMEQATPVPITELPCQSETAPPDSATRLQQEAELLAQLRSHQKQPAKTRRHTLVYAAVALLSLALVLFYAGSMEKPATLSAPAIPEADKTATESSPRSAVQTAPLELHIPRNRPAVNIDIYVVVQGDTLWNISERFTGDPFNYPRIAGENKLADPDLIFPGQRIRLIK